jgi:uncharacterized protein DUF4389
MWTVRRVGRSAPRLGSNGTVAAAKAAVRWKPRIGGIVTAYPVHVRARPDSPSRLLWLVKWLLLIPHYVVLVGLWVAFVAMTVVAYIVVLFTGRYPRDIFDFNVGVLRWSWRVGYYGYQVLGTDRYPPFTLAADPDYPADLVVEYPDRIPRYQPLVAWLLALPHAVLLGAIAGSGWVVFRNENPGLQTSLGLLTIAVVIAAVGLAFTGEYPRGLFNLLTGFARWGLRVVAYVTLLTRRYPPFRLDQGAEDPIDPDGPPPPGSGTVAPWISPSAPSAPPAPPRVGPGATVVKVVALVIGVLLMLLGLGVGIGGGVLLAVNSARDADGYATSPNLTLATPTAAVVSSDVTIQGTDAWQLRWGDFGTVRVSATAQSQTPLFLGVGLASDVNRWLAGTARDEVTRAWGSTTSPQYRRISGDLRALSPPTEQTFWVSQATGAGTIQLQWDALASDGRYVLVLANADGSLSVAARSHIGVKVPPLVPLGSGLLVTAGVFILGAFALIIVGASGLGRRRGGPPAPPTGPAEPIGPPPAAAPPTGPPATPVTTGS